jgi:hypothetical protein
MYDSALYATGKGLRGAGHSATLSAGLGSYLTQCLSTVYFPVRHQSADLCLPLIHSEMSIIEVPRRLGPLGHARWRTDRGHRRRL